MKAMNFNEGIPELPIDFFTDHYLLVFDLTSLQDADENVHYPELSGESLRLEMFFERLLTNVTELNVLGERTSTVKIDPLLKMSEELCINQDFLFFFSIFYGFILFPSALKHLLDMYFRRPVATLFIL